MRFGLTRLLAHESDLEACGETGSVSDVIAETKGLQPDLALIGAPLDRSSPSDLLIRLKAEDPSLRILIGTRAADSGLIRHLMRNGADGCVHWGEPLVNVLKAIRTVLQGDVYYLGSVRPKHHPQQAGVKESSGDSGVDSLSEREMRIFTLIGQGMTGQQIAKSLDLSPRTVQSHRRNIKLKLGVCDAVTLNRDAFRWWHDNS